MNITQSVGRAASYFIPQPPSSDLTTLAKNFFLDYSIFTAIDPKWLATNQKSLSCLSFSGKLQHSAKVATVCFIRNIIISYVTTKIFLRLINWTIGNEEKENNQYKELILKKPINATLVSPILEELVFRGILFNFDHYLQKGIIKLTPSCLQKTCLYEVLSSPGFSHVDNGFGFALCHWGNRSIIRTDQAFFHVLFQFLFISSEFSILYNSTGTIFAPITAHIINNTLCLLMLKIFSK